MSMHNLYFLNGNLADHFLKGESQAQWLKNPKAESSNKKESTKQSWEVESSPFCPNTFVWYFNI